MTANHETVTPPPSPPPPRGPRAWVIVAAVALALASLAAGALFADRLRSATARLIAAVFHDHRAVSADGTITYYTCGMHPWVILPQPGDCPICHMKLEPIDPAKYSGGITIDPVMVQNMGVRVESVVTGPLTASIRTVGTVEYAEPLVRDINTKVGGWIEKLHVSSLGAQVKAGDVLFDVYSPELYSAQEEFLLAARNAREHPGEANERLLESVRTRLRYFDVSEKQIEQLAAAGHPSKTLAIRSPFDGIVVEKSASEGQRVEPGMRLYRLADLSKVWVMGTIYEYHLPYIREGQEAVMSLPYIPGQTFAGKVIYVYPFLSEGTRQARVRLEFDNPTGLLKPGMFANVTLASRLAEERVLAPRSAIIDTGTRRLAFVSLGEGRFEPRQVQIGVQTEGDMVEVIDGLKPGEKVVTSGQFLIDSEARIRESLAKMIRGEPAAEQQAVVSTAPGAGPSVALPDEVKGPLTSLLAEYLKIGQTLAADQTQGVADHARAVAASADAMLKASVPGDEHFWRRHPEIATVRGKALEIVGAPDIAAVRLHYADLSVALAKFLGATGVPAEFGHEVHQLHCPMYLEGQGGSTWLQLADRVRNPYYGAMMLECYDKRFALPVGK